MKKRALFVYTKRGSKSICKQIPKHLNERIVLVLGMSKLATKFWKVFAVL